ncbi:hypothetical protein B0J14DRAFT_676540 [Halenospora varia]|nr:hypothetical protein B0J14DRAFT_676540 [Halenospora varia]
MSSTSSNSPVPMQVEEPRKNGFRGEKRLVTHLSKAQLARKRASDRKTQRNIRQRTKEHIENLERKVKELEDELEKLRAQVNIHHTTVTPAQISPEIPEGFLIMQEVTLDWVSEPEPCTWPQPTSSHIPALDTNPDIPVSNTTYPSTNAQIFPPATTWMGYNEEAPQALYTPSATPIWDVLTALGPQTSQSLSKPFPAWAPYQ